MKKIFTIIIVICALTNSLKAQEGFYVGMGLNMNSAREEVLSSDKNYDFSHSTKSTTSGLLTQNLGDYGFGFNIGYEKIFGSDTESATKKGFTLGGQYYFNYQNLELKSKINGLDITTQVDYNHGWRFTYGYHFGKIHPYLLFQATYQTVTPDINTINNEGVYDVTDGKEILDTKLVETGDQFTTFTAAFLGGFGIEFPINEKYVLDINYVPLKHVEYGLKDVKKGNYFVNGLAVNNLQVGIRFYPF